MLKKTKKKSYAYRFQHDVKMLPIHNPQSSTYDTSWLFPNGMLISEFQTESGWMKNDSL